MKRIILSIIATLALTLGAKAQCGDELMKQALGLMGSFQYIKDFDVKLAQGASTEGTKFSVVLNSRTRYQLNVANGASNTEEVVISIFDGDTKLGSNSIGGKMYKSFMFDCSKTGAYKLQVSCPGGSEACARVVLALVKQLPAQ